MGTIKLIFKNPNQQSIAQSTEPTQQSSKSKRTKHSQYFTCLICNKQVLNEESKSHFELELNRLDTLPYTTKRLSKEVKGKQSQIVETNTKSLKHTIKEQEKIFKQLKSNQLKRKSSTFDEIPTTHECFICHVTLPSDPEYINAHINDCLNNSTVDQEAADTSWTEYEYDGQVRVRATALLQGNYEAAGYQVRKRTDMDTDEEIDVDDDNEEFGTSQYNEADIQKFITNDEDEEPTEIVQNIPLVGVTHPPNENVLVLDSLKSRIRELESLTGNIPTCLICMDPYSTPCTSIVCWHVHCERCWLQTLATKRLCPQCQKITCANDLRRIYL
ncbi:hypothetical protein BC833DRAFT_590605 [Globomyces pollinis-pini]|nr:hypothetical protein BC833DRAFT_590605 [Globomyces pollinis-pini]